MKTLGFTLIELMVSVTILLLITGGAMAGFVRFQERRNVEETTKKMQQVFIAARNKAEVKESPSSCTATSPLQGYRVAYDSGTRIVSLVPLCGANPEPITAPPVGPAPQTALVKYNVVIPSGIVVSFPGGEIDFYTLQRGTSGSGTTNYTLTSGGTTYSFSVDRGSLGGTISNVEN